MFVQLSLSRQAFPEQTEQTRGPLPKNLPSKTTTLTTTAKMLYLIGLGLSDETDITVKGLETVKKCARVYLEAYTSILLVDKTILVRTFEGY